MKNLSKKLVIKLLGVGGNLKTSITKEFTSRHPEFLIIPESHREYEAFLNKYGDYTTICKSMGVKKIVTEVALSSASRFFITDRSLFDSAILNELIKRGTLADYHGSHSDWMNFEEALKLEEDTYKDCYVVTVMLKTLNEEFIDMMMEGDDARASFYKTREFYLHCQEYYNESVHKHLKVDLNICLTDFNHIPYTVSGICDGIQDFINREYTE